MLYLNRLVLACCVWALGCVLVMNGHILCAQNQPNFVFILTDDQSYGLMGCTGNEIVQTPNLDGLAEDGVLFERAHITSAICTPSRVSILLSQYERKHGVNFNSGTSVAPDAWAKSYPVVMREAGYYTGYVGKNHAPIGHDGYESGLMEQSFDYWYAGHKHLRFYPKASHEIFEGATANTQAEILQEGMLDFLDNETRLAGAVQFLDQRPTDQPFCLSICFNLPHGAGTSTMKQKPSDPEIYKSLYRDQAIPLPDHYVAKADIAAPKLPPALLHAEERQSSYNYVDNPDDLTERMIRQMQAMTGIDSLVGALRRKLGELDLDSNTVIIFTSDHGLFGGQFGLGGKALCYEQCTHVPMIIYHPLEAERHRGKRNEELVQSIDIAPTMLSLAGIPIPSTMQGKDLSAMLRGDDASVREYLFTENLWSTQFGNPRCESVQDTEWKYIRYYQNNVPRASSRKKLGKKIGIAPNHMYYRIHATEIAMYRSFAEGPFLGEQPVYEELYHLAEDPDETTNLVDVPAHAAILKTMRAACTRLLTEARGTEAPKVVRYTPHVSGKDVAWATFDQVGQAYYTFGNGRTIYRTELDHETDSMGRVVATGQRPFVSRDGRLLLYDHEGTIFLRAKRAHADGWHPPVPLGSHINASGQESCAALSPDETHLIYARDLATCDFVYEPFVYTQDAELPPYLRGSFEEVALVAGRPFSVDLTADSVLMDDNGLHTLSYAAQLILSGGLPEGVTLDAKTGRLSGMIPQAGRYALEIRATDPGGQAAMSSLMLKVRREE